jgi:hypothetical protein
MLPLFLIYFTLIEHTYNTFIFMYYSSSTTLDILRSVEGLLWGAEPRIRACLTASRHATDWACRTLLKHAAP